jgi:hypothetical protein
MRSTAKMFGTCMEEPLANFTTCRLKATVLCGRVYGAEEARAGASTTDGVNLPALTERGK